MFGGGPKKAQDIFPQTRLFLKASCWHHHLRAAPRSPHASLRKPALRPTGRSGLRLAFRHDHAELSTETLEVLSTVGLCMTLWVQLVKNQPEVLSVSQAMEWMFQICAFHLYPRRLEKRGALYLVLPPRIALGRAACRDHRGGQTPSEPNGKLGSAGRTQLCGNSGPMSSRIHHIVSCDLIFLRNTKFANRQFTRSSSDLVT